MKGKYNKVGVIKKLPNIKMFGSFLNILNIRFNVKKSLRRIEASESVEV